MLRALSSDASKAINFSGLAKHPKGFWKSKTNQRSYLAWLSHKMGFNNMEDWYSVSSDTFKKNHGSGLLNHYHNSPHAILTGVLGDHEWRLWRMQSKLPTNFWQHPDNVTSFMHDLGSYLKKKNVHDQSGSEKEVNLEGQEENLSHWYNVTQADFISQGGGALLQKYGYSPSQILYTVFPQHEWLPWKFVSAPQNIWLNEQICMKYMNWLGGKLGFTKMEDWYQVKQSDFYQNYGKTLLGYYSGSPRMAVTSIFKSHSWEPWRFGGKFQTLISDDVGDPKVTAQIKKYVEEELKVQCNVTHLKDWYQVPPTVLDRVKKKAIVQRSGGIIGLLRRAYPDHVWDWNQLKITRKKAQQQMIAAIRELFPNYKIFVDYLHPDIVYNHNKESIELDAFIPDLKLAFEFQGPHHYQQEMFFKNLSEGDLEKSGLCEHNGITLIAVPYWWDKKVNSLAFLINKVRPDLLKDFNSNDPPNI